MDGTFEQRGSSKENLNEKHTFVYVQEFLGRIMRKGTWKFSFPQEILKARGIERNSEQRAY